jgi:uncharacterized membrane protein HdeD (DUF308 family)
LADFNFNCSGGARAGQVYPVPLPTSSPLRANEGVHHVRSSGLLVVCVVCVCVSCACVCVCVCAFVCVVCVVGVCAYVRGMRDAHSLCVAM